MITFTLFGNLVPLPSWMAPTLIHYNDALMSLMASQITSLTIVCSAGYSGADQRKHQSSASLGFVLGIHRWPVNTPHKGPVRRKLFPFDYVIMRWYCAYPIQSENNSGLLWEHASFYVTTNLNLWLITDFISNFIYGYGILYFTLNFCSFQ